MTYSRCCQRPSSPRRLATLVLPLTAPTAGSANGWTSRRTASGSNTVSPSTMHQQVVRAPRAMPVLRAAALPALGCRTSRTPGRPSRSTMSAGAVGGAVVDDDRPRARVVAARPASARSARCPRLVVGGHDAPTPGGDTAAPAARRRGRAGVPAARRTDDQHGAASDRSRDREQPPSHRGRPASRTRGPPRSQRPPLQGRVASAGPGRRRRAGRARRETVVNR